MEKYNLTWDSHSDDLRNMLRGFFTSRNFADVTLICDDMKKIKAHKNILGAWSPVLKDIFETELGQPSIVYLRGINHSTMESVVQFIYLGEVSLNEDSINDLLSVAKDLKIWQLCEAKVIEDETEQIHMSELEGETVDHPFFVMETPEINTNIPVKQEKNTLGYSDLLQDSKTDIKMDDQNYGMKSDKEYQCPNCRYKSNRMSNLKQHIKSRHQGMRYPCNHCDRDFNSPSGLRTHMKGVHPMIA